MTVRLNRNIFVGSCLFFLVFLGLNIGQHGSLDSQFKETNQWSVCLSKQTEITHELSEELSPIFPECSQAYDFSEKFSSIPPKNSPQAKIQQGEYLELSEFAGHYHYPNGSIRFSSRLGDQNTWDGKQYQYYVYNEIEKSIQYANSKIRFYDWYAVVEQSGSIVVDDCRWIVEYWREQGGGSWNTLDLYNHYFYDPIISAKSIIFTQGYDDGSSYLNVSYVVTNNARVKINVDFVSGIEDQIRFVWQLSGMAGELNANMSTRTFSFDDIIISCNDTDLKVGFSYEWTVATKKLNVQIGQYNVSIGSKIVIDPTFSAKQTVDEQDWYGTSAGVCEVYITDNTFYAGPVNPDHYNASVVWDTGITDTIASTSNAQMSLYVSQESQEANEHLGLGLYFNSTLVGGFWNESLADTNDATAMGQATYYDNDSWYDFNGLANTNVTIGDSDIGIFIDEWETHHDNDPSNRQYINFKFFSGVDMELSDYVRFPESTYDAYPERRPSLEFTYTTGGGNNAPAAVVDTAVSSDLYAGKEFTFKTNHTDSDGAADLDRLYSGLGPTSYIISFNASAGTGSLSVSTDNGSTYVISVSASGASITNGYQVTWTVQLDWDFPYDDKSIIDTHARSRDDEPAYSSWNTHNTNANFENDLEIVSLIVSIDGGAEYGGTNGQIDDGDWFRGGVETTSSGTIEYEASSQTFNSSYAAAVNVTLYFDGSSTGQGDTVILNGAFSGITYTPTSASGLDLTAYFDVQIHDIPTNGSDVTGSAIEITSKRDNENPSGYSISLIADTASIGYAPNTGYYDDDSVDSSVSGASDGSGSGLPTDCYSWQIDSEGWSAYGSATTHEFSSVSDGDHILYVKVRDNVGNEGAADSTNVTVDTDSPTGFTITWDRMNGTYPIVVFNSNNTIYFDPGNECDNYTTITVNNDGSINNSGFWKVEWDKNSIFETAANDTSGLPDNKNFYYQGDGNGTFIIRIVNNAGNYQTISYNAIDTYDGGCGETSTTTTTSPGADGDGGDGDGGGGGDSDITTKMPLGQLFFYVFLLLAIVLLIALFVQRSEKWGL